MPIREKKMARYYFECEGHKMLIDAKSKGHAAQMGFRFLIRDGKIKRRPPALTDGGWVNTFIIFKGYVGQKQEQFEQYIPNLDKKIGGLDAEETITESTEAG